MLYVPAETKLNLFHGKLKTVSIDDIVPNGTL